MSGNIRKALGPIHGRLKTHIKKYREIAPEGFDPNKLTPDGKTKTITALKRLGKKLSKTISDTEKYLEKWEHLINTSAPADATEEKATREKFFQQYGSIPDTLKLAEDVLDDAERLLESLGASLTPSDRSDSNLSQKSTDSQVSQHSVILETTSVGATPVNSPKQQTVTTTTTTPVHPAGQLSVPPTNTVSVPLTEHVPTPTLTTSTVGLPLPSTVPMQTSVALPVATHQNPVSYLTNVNAAPQTALVPYDPSALSATNTSALTTQNLVTQASAFATNNTAPAVTTYDFFSSIPTTRTAPAASAVPVLPTSPLIHSTAPVGHHATFQSPSQPSLPVTSKSLKALVENYQNFQPLTQAELALIPQIKLEIFDGNQLKFFSWLQLFFILIHSKLLDNVVKFQILVNHLAGEAADVISGLSITGQNYLTALGTLIDTYGDTCPQRHSLRNELFQMKPINGTRRPEDIADCRKIIRIYRELVNLGDSCDHEWAGQIIEKKLPRSALSDLYKEFPEGTTLNAQKVLDTLQRIIKHEQRVERSYCENRPEEQIRKAPSPFKPFIRTIGSVNTSVQSQQRFSKPTKYQSYTFRKDSFQFNNKCSLCPGLHQTSDCQQYPTPEKRKEAAQAIKACFNCLRTDHSVRDCPSKGTCRFCNQRHHTALCTSGRRPNFRSVKPIIDNRQTSFQRKESTFQRSNIPQSQQQQKQKFGQQTQKRVSFNSRTNANTNAAVGVIGWEDFNDAYGIDDDETIHSATFTSKANEDVLKACFEIEVCNPDNPNNKLRCFAVLDTCSTHSYCDPSLAQKLELTCTRAALSVKGIGKTETRVEAQKCNLGIKNDEKVISIQTYGWKDFMPHVKRIPLEQVDDVNKATSLPQPIPQTVSVLIGQDKALSFLLNSKVTPIPSGHKLVDIGIGKFVCGEGQLKEFTKCVETFTTVLQQLENNHDQELTEKVDRQNAIDSLPFSDNPKDNDAELARLILHENITIDPETGRLKVPLLFKESLDDLPSNLGLATATLYSVYKKHKDQPEILQKIDDIFKEQFKLNMLQLVGDLKDEVEPEKQAHYLPHFPVLTPAKKTTKVRVVVNGSAKTKRKRSLNDYILPGPSTIPDMASVLLRFRTGKIAISSDIEKAFLQISLDEKHRDYVRILWLKDFTKPPTRDNILIYRYARVPFGINCSPFLLGGSIAYHLSKIGTLIAEEIKRNIFVDNSLVFAETVEEAIQKYYDIREIFGNVKMNIREFVSNSKEFNAFLEQQTGEAIPDDTKILGVYWHIKEDSLKISLPDPKPCETDTKRKCLRILASVPDIFGFLLPIILIAKLFFQKLWKSNVTWDEKIDTADWEIATQGWKNFEYSFPRRMISSTHTKKEIHVFCDASAEAAAAVAYIKEYAEGKSTTTIIFAKNRIKPLNTEKNGKTSLTIPRMELISLLIAVRMGHFLLESLDIIFDSINIWTDSKICLNWLTNPPAKDIFVKNRIFQILEKGDKFLYRHINGIFNPADVASRGCTPEQLVNHNLWWHGPPILQQASSEYPSVTPLTTERREKPLFTLVSQTIETDPIVETSQFHSFRQLLGTIFFIFSYITFLKLKTGKQLTYPWTLFQHRRKTAQNLLFVEHWLIKQLQKRNPPDLKDNKKFSIKKDEHGIFRCYGRLANSELELNAKFPIWLPRKDNLTKLIVQHIHETSHHAGTRTTLAALRQHYWISQGRKTVENTIHNCFECRRLLAKPFHQPSPPPFPKNRVTKSLPFEHVGIDYFGPVTVKLDSINIKKWVSLFTCLTTRLLHLEIVDNLTTIEFLHSLRRFISRRGHPMTIISDNATTFRLAAQVENRARQLHFQDPELLDYCANNGILWKNIPELSPWFGGAYERMVGLTKNTLKRAIGRHIPKVVEFATYLCEAEALVNSRPLCYIFENEPNQQILRPLDFILPCSQIGSIRFPRTEDDDDPTWKTPFDQEKDKLIDLWKLTQKMLDNFWNLWKTDYLQSLRENEFLEHKGPRSQTYRSPKLGEIVIIGEQDIPRGQWRLGKVIELPATETARTVKILMGNKRILTRPVKLCYPLEITSYDTENCKPPPPLMTSEPTPLRRSPRLRQSANFGLTTILLLCLFGFASAQTASTISDTNSTEQSPQIQFLTAKCVKGGIQIEQKLNFQHLEICSLFYCTAYNKPPDDGLLLLPSTITSDAYTYQIRAWNHGKLVTHKNGSCEGLPLCETLCSFCLNQIRHYECYNITTFLLGTFIILCLLSFLRNVIFLLMCLRYLFLFIFKIITYPCRNRVNAQAHNRRNLMERLATFAIVFVSTSYASDTACSSVASLSGTSNNCYFNEEGISRCTYDQSILVSLLAINQDYCVQLSDNNNHTIGTLTVKVKSFYLECNKKTSYYTRDHKFQSESSHRCAGMSLCYDEKCGATNDDTRFSELSATSYSFPGYSLCHSSCGCITCNGCGRCDSSCIFSRVYVSPTSNSIFEVFDCPSWSPFLNLFVTFKTNDTSTSTDLSLSPSIPEKWNSVTVTLAASSIPPSPLMGKSFITDGQNTAVTDVSPPGQPTPGQIGQLQCSSLTNAQNFSTCKYNKDICQCSPSDYSIHCDCHDGTVSTILSNSDQKLPLNNGQFSILKSADSATAVLKSSTSIQLMLEMHNLQATSLITETTCKASLSSAAGCYSCNSGATAILQCITSFGTTTAILKCGNTTYTSKCSYVSTDTEIKIHHDAPQINQNCTLTCSLTTMNMNLNGDLTFFETQFIGMEGNVGNLDHDVNEGIPIKGFLENLWDNIKFLGIMYIVYMFIVILILGCCLYKFFPLILAILFPSIALRSSPRLSRPRHRRGRVSTKHV